MKFPAFYRRILEDFTEPHNSLMKGQMLEKSVKETMAPNKK